jgi:hypothetical protein
MTDRQELVVTILSRFTSEELAALTERRRDAEQRHGWQVAGNLAESFWSHIESDPGTDAAWDRLAKQWKPPKRRSRRAVRNPSRYGQAALDAECRSLADVEKVSATTGSTSPPTGSGAWSGPTAWTVKLSKLL